MIQELDLVALLADRPALGLRRGDVGTVVHAYAVGDLYEVEFTNATGETVAVETLEAHEVRAVSGQEADDEERRDFLYTSGVLANRAYGEDEPDYTDANLIEPNPNYQPK